jgi:hypothetical protein
LADEFADQLDLKIDKKEITNADFGPQGKHPSLIAKLHGDSTVNYYMRIIINGPYYSMMFCKPGKSDEHDRFFSSFKIESPDYAEGFEEVKDTSMHFRVMSFPEKDKSNLSRLMREQMRGYISEDDDFDSYSPSKTQNRTFNSPESRSSIFVTTTKYNPFYYVESTDAFWKVRIASLNPHKRMLISGQKNYQKDSLDITELTLTDTASTRGYTC